MDLFQTSYTSERATRQAVDMFGVDRLFFGTDGPSSFHGPDHQYDYGFIKRRIEGMFPDIKIRKVFLGKALRTLLVYVRKEEIYGKVDFNLNNKMAMIIKDSTMKYLKENVI